MREHLVLAANAVAPRGGQGLNLAHMVEALRGDFDLNVVCRGGVTSAPQTTVDGSRAARALMAVPVVRRLRDVVTLAEDSHFDREVAALLPGLRPQVFQGVVGQCCRSLRVARGLGARTVLDSVTTHVDDLKGHMDREGARMGVRGPINAVQRARILREYERSDLIRVMSRVALRTFVERGFDERRFVVATPPIDPSQFQAVGPRRDRFVVGFVGLIEPWKGFHHLLQAYDALRLPGAELAFWGGPGARPISRMLAEYQARAAGIRLERAEVRSVGYAAVYGAMSVLVHPSLSDGFGYVVAEAMASGVPVIVTDNTGAADLVEDGVNGYVVRGGDVGALRDRLEHLWRHQDELTTMGARARATALGRLRAETFREALVTGVRGVLA